MRVRFTEFVLDAGRRELRRGREPVALRPKTFQLLQALIERRPKAVAQDELYDLLWPGTFVHKTSLHKLVYQLRKALGDDGQTIIRTVYGFGFAFAAPAADDAPAARPLYILVIGESEFELREGETVIGRERGLPLRMEARSVSRRHARIVIDGTRVTIEDLHSRNGTSVGGKRVHTRELADGDALLFGNVPATLRIVPAEGSTETAI
jgi:DNA-binding winged helix-turn-helix (wHTH) protein